MLYQCWISLNCYSCHSNSTSCKLWPFQIHTHKPKRIHFFNSIFCTTLGKIHGDFWMAVSRERLIRGSCPAVRNWPPFLNCKTQNQINNHSAALVQRIHIAQVCWKEHLFDNRADADVRVSTAYCRPKVTMLISFAWTCLSESLMSVCLIGNMSIMD